MVAVNRYSVEQVVEAMRRARGIKVVAAKILGCERNTVQNYCKRYSTVQEAANEARETLIDIAEGKLVQRVDAGDWDAVRFVLTTIGKDRGYVQRHENTGADGGPIQQAIVGMVEVRAVDYRTTAALLKPPAEEEVAA